MNRAWRWALVPAYPLLAVNAIIALAYAVIWCRATMWEWREGVLTFVARRRMIGNPGGQGWSWIVGYASDVQRDRRDLRVHENVHVVQEVQAALLFVPVAAIVGYIAGWPAGLAVLPAGGLCFALSYGLFFLVEYARRGFGPWHAAYLAIPYEAQAYARQRAYLSLPPTQQVEVWGHR